jgi:hypothetical protein
MLDQSFKHIFNLIRVLRSSFHFQAKQAAAQIIFATTADSKLALTALNPIDFFRSLITDHFRLKFCSSIVARSTMTIGRTVDPSPAMAPTKVDHCVFRSTSSWIEEPVYMLGMSPLTSCASGHSEQPISSTLSTRAAGAP